MNKGNGQPSQETDTGERGDVDKGRDGATELQSIDGVAWAAEGGGSDP